MTEKPTAFDAAYSGVYEKFSGEIRGYEVAAKVLAVRLKEHRPHVKDVCEIGSGTGNSAIAGLFENIPSIQNVFAIEPSDLILLARAKQKGDPDALFAPGAAPAYAHEMAKRLEPYKSKLHLVKAKGEAIPFKPESMDAVFMSQVFHWLDRDKSLSEMKRILKPGGVVVFDASGYQFDFGNSPEGKEINGALVSNHPFLSLFEKNLFELLQLHGKPPEASKYLYNIHSIRRLLYRHGFKLLPDKNGKLFTTTIDEFSHEKIIATAKGAGRMRIARMMPELLNTPDVADNIIEKALERTNQEWSKHPQEAGRVYANTLATFVAVKMDPDEIRRDTRTSKRN